MTVPPVAEAAILVSVSAQSVLLTAFLHFRVQPPGQPQQHHHLITHHLAGRGEANTQKRLPENVTTSSTPWLTPWLTHTVHETKKTDDKHWLIF